MNFNWKQFIKPSQNRVLGLDIGSSAVKIIQLHKDADNYTVTAAAMKDIPDSGDDNEQTGEINTIETIRECYISAAADTQLAVCGVCGPEVAVRRFQFPVLPLDEVEGAVALEASQVCPFDVEQASVDYQLMSDDDKGLKGILVAATNPQIEAKRHLAESAQFDNVLMDVEGLALLNCFEACEGSSVNQTVAILNVGSLLTTLAITDGDDTAFIRDIAFGGKDIIEQIAKENEISPKTVNDILTGGTMPTDIDLGFGASLERACKKLITGITETIRFHSVEEKSTFVEKIFVCGGFALTDGFIEVLENSLPVSVVLWNPFEKLRCGPQCGCKKLLDTSGPALAVAAGLAMRTI